MRTKIKQWLNFPLSGLGIASILIALVFRIAASILAVTPSPLNWKERFFVAVAWIPKATVQAAIGPLALDSARTTGNPILINWGEQVKHQIPIEDCFKCC